AGIVAAPMPRGGLAAAFVVSLAAQLAIVPVALVHFNQLSTIGIVANLAAVPLAGAATVLGLIALAAAAAGGLPPPAALGAPSPPRRSWPPSGRCSSSYERSRRWRRPSRARSSTCRLQDRRRS